MREVWPDDISSTSLFKKNKIEFKVMTRELVLQDPIYDTTSGTGMNYSNKFTYEATMPV